MKKWFKKLYGVRLEILCLVLVGLILQIALYWRALRDAAYAVQAILFVSLVLAVVTLYLLLRLLWRAKWLKKVAGIAKAIGAGVSSLLVRLLDKWNASKWNIFARRRGFVSGNTTVTFDFFANRERKENKIKPPKWKHMQTEREKLGYLYFHLITSYLKRGLHAKRTDTPSEIKARTESTPPEERVFDLYIDARYDERAELQEKELDGLKETLFKKKG